MLRVSGYFIPTSTQSDLPLLVDYERVGMSLRRLAEEISNPMYGRRLNGLSIPSQDVVGVEANEIRRYEAYHSMYLTELTFLCTDSSPTMSTRNEAPSLDQSWNTSRSVPSLAPPCWSLVAFSSYQLLEQSTHSTWMRVASTRTSTFSMVRRC
jgi:hypothetical protein